MKQLGCVLLAAGNARRFGSNKLLATFDGLPLFERALQAVCHLPRVCVVTQYEAFARRAERLGCAVVYNHAPQEGLSRSVRLGTQALSHCDGILFSVADQPFLHRELIDRLVQFWQKSPDAIVAAAWEGRRGNPCIFPRVFFPELCALTGDAGGSAVIRAHPDRLVTVPAEPHLLMDADTPEDLAFLETYRKKAAP